MELAGTPRRAMTLSDQLAVPDSTNLRDLLKAHNSLRRRRGDALTLASASGRTLLEILREDEGRSPVGRGGATTAGAPPEGGPSGGGSAEAVAEGSLSLMALLEQTEWEGRGGGEGAAAESQCCVCMTRHKGAAFIPCGHTFCRPCSRELWVRRRSCPLCNATILDILDIY